MYRVCMQQRCKSQEPATGSDCGGRWCDRSSAGGEEYVRVLEHPAEMIIFSAGYFL